MAAPIRIHIDTPHAATSFARTAIEKAIIDTTNWAVKEIVAKAQENIQGNTKTGTARRSITAEPVVYTGHGVIGTVGAGGAGAPYASDLEFGTGIWGPKHQKYPIVPVRKKALAWGRNNPGSYGPAVKATDYLSMKTNMVMGPPGGPNLRLSGAVRTPVLKAIQGHVIPHSHVYMVRRHVMHPGHPPMPFLGPAFETVSEKMVDRLAVELARIFVGH